VLRVATPAFLALALASLPASLCAAGAGSVSVRELQIPQSAKDRYEDAQRRVAKLDADGARKKLEEAVRLAPEYSAAWNALGALASEVETDPENADAALNLGGLLLKSGRVEEALGYNRQVSTALPGDASAQAQFGMNLYQLGMLVEAERALLAAKRIDPGHYTLPQLFLAEIYARRGDKERAAEELQDLLARRPVEPLATTLRDTLARLR
jgi:tetratricopeptide (TPR) repeat protein